MVSEGTFLGPPISIEWGLDADRSAAPEARSAYYAHDTEVLYICWVAGAWEVLGPPGAVDLGDLGDVNVAGIADGFILYWNDAASEWQVQAIPAAAWAAITGKPTAPSLEELATEHDAAGLHAGMDLDDIGDVNVPAPADGDLLTFETATGLWIPVAPAVGGGDYPFYIKPNVNRWCIPGWYSGTGYGVTGNFAGWIVYVPIFVDGTATFTEVGVWVQTAAVGTAEIRLYSWNNGLPDALLQSPGTFSTNVLGARTLAINWPLTRGYYVLAYRHSPGNAFLRGLDVQRACFAPYQGSSVACTPPFSGLIPVVNAAFADPAPAPTTLWTLAAAIVFLREN